MAESTQTTTTTEPASSESTHWHLILGMLLKALLEAVGITVQMEAPVTRKPLKLDILLIRHAEPGWTAEQQARLPDGIRQRREPNILCEFKYTESVNRDALVQALNYETLYRLGNELPERAIATFVVSGKTPSRKFLTEYGYVPSELPGIYRTPTAGWSRVELLVLNELQNEPYNAFFKCFASRKTARKAAFALLEHLDGSMGPAAVWEIVAGLRSLFAEAEEETMTTVTVTPEYVQSLGAGIRRMIVNTLTPEERLAGVAPKELLERLTPKERLEGLAPKERLEGLAPEELLANLDPAVIEAYLRGQAVVQDRVIEAQPSRKATGTAKTKARKARKRLPS